MLLKLLANFSFALKNDLKKTTFFSNVFIPLSKLFNSIVKLLCLLSGYPSFISLKNQ